MALGSSSELMLVRNLSANVIGKAVTGALGFLFIPVYIHFLGIESYGLVGLFASITALAAAADCGLSATASRELSRQSVQPGSDQAVLDLVRTLEFACWFIAILLGALIMLGTPYIVRGWVDPIGLSPETVRHAVMEMGIALALQWPVNFYANAIIGLQQQVVLNVINVSITAVRGIGAVLLLWAVSSSIEAFFAWQIVISACHVLCAKQQMWRRLPAGAGRGHIQFDAMRSVWRFTVGMSGLTLLTVANAQIDKVVLSQSLTLTEFGYYAFAWAIAGYLSMLSEPIMLAFLPHMTRLVSLNDETGLSVAYHNVAQVMSIAILPFTMVIVLFSNEIIVAWTKDPTVAQHAAPLVGVLVCGSAIQAVSSPPLALQWAHGWTIPAIWGRIGALIVQIPATYILGHRFGAEGGAVVWLGTNIFIAIATVFVSYKRLLFGKLVRWLCRDLLPPSATALAMAIIWRAFDAWTDGRNSIVFILLAAISALLAAVATVPVGRHALAVALRRGIYRRQLALYPQDSAE